jgi:uncharacterized protein (DUF362 family)
VEPEEEAELKREKVSIVRCASTAEDAEVVRRTEEAIYALGDYAAGFRHARKIAVKINAGIPRIVLTDGKQTELTDPAVVEGAIRAIRAATDAEIVVGDATTSGHSHALYEKLGYPERLASYPHVRLVDFGEGEMREMDNPHPSALLRRYTLHHELAEAEAYVSLAKMKAHTGMGITLCIKNLFGWTPTRVYGTPRNYLHDRLIRLPHALTDLAAIMRPCLNVVDGTVAANMSEWHGHALRPGVILAGTNIVATDSVGARVMGVDPSADYPEHPFFYRRNAIALAAQAGLGPLEEESIEVIGPAPEEVRTPFEVHRYSGATDRDGQLLRGAACVAHYRERQAEYAERYRGRYLALIDGEVLWDAPDMQTIQKLEHDSGRDWRTAPQFVVRCISPEEEIEQMDWYRIDADIMCAASGVR